MSCILQVSECSQVQDHLLCSRLSRVLKHTGTLQSMSSDSFPTYSTCKCPCVERDGGNGWFSWLKNIPIILLLSSMQHSLAKIEKIDLCYCFLRLVCLSIEQWYFIPSDGCCYWLILTWSYSSKIIQYCCWSFNCIVIRQWIDRLSMISFEWSLRRSWLSSFNGLPIPLITLISASTCVANTCSFWVAPVCSWGFLWPSLSMPSLFPIMDDSKLR